MFLIVGKPFLQVSEHASWSGCFYFRIIQAALAAVGAPENLVDVITGSVYFIYATLLSMLLSNYFSQLTHSFQVFGNR